MAISSEWSSVHSAMCDVGQYFFVVEKGGKGGMANTVGSYWPSISPLGSGDEKK